MSYVYHMVNWESAYAVYGDDEKGKSERIAKDLDIKVDKVIERAVETYRELYETDATISLESARKALQTSRKVINTLSEHITDVLDERKSSEELTPARIEQMMSQVQSLLKVSNEIPKMIGTLENLEEKVRKERSSASRIRGGGKIGMYEE